MANPIAAGSRPGHTLSGLETFEHFIDAAPQVSRPFLLDTIEDFQPYADRVVLRNGNVMSWNGVILMPDSRGRLKVVGAPYRPYDGRILYHDGWIRYNNGVFQAPSGLMINSDNLSMRYSNGIMVRSDLTRVRTYNGHETPMPPAARPVVGVIERNQQVPRPGPPTSNNRPPTIRTTVPGLPPSSDSNPTPEVESPSSGSAAGPSEPEQQLRRLLPPPPLPRTANEAFRGRLPAHFRYLADDCGVPGCGFDNWGVPRCLSHEDRVLAAPYLRPEE